MSTEESKAVVRRFLDEVISRGNLAALDELCAPDLVWHGGSVGEFRSLEAFKQGVGPFFTAFPDLRVAPHDLLGEGGKVEELHEVFDQLSLMQQIGAIPSS